MKKTKSISYIGRPKPTLVFVTLLFLVILHGINPPFVNAKKQPSGDSRLVPASLLRWPEQGSDYAILVEKSTERLFLYHRENIFAPLKVYKVSTGENEGRKLRENDRKTPEGIYFFTDSYLKRELAPRYGVRAFPIDYPNPLDKRAGRDGYGIWFHGLNKPLKPQDTNGCIALDNRNIDELASYIKLNETPTIITSKIEWVEPENLKKEKEELENIIETWRRSWERKEIDRYISLYSSRFTSGGKNWRQWKNYKARLARKYKHIEVKVENLRLLKNDGIILAKFDQSYRTGRFESWGEKRLYLQQNSTQWKIIGEVFERVKKKRAPAAKRLVSSSKEIKNFISSWKKAWEQKDLETYIAFYDADFRSRGMDLKAWKKHREKLNRKYRSLKIDISSFKVEQISGRTARVRFKQNYRADEYYDYGLKKILLIKEGENWKIQREKWRPLSRKSRP